MSQRLPLRQVQVPPGTTDGEVPVYDVTTDRLVMGPPSNGLDSVIVTVVGGVPMLMFDDDSTPVTTEVPS